MHYYGTIYTSTFDEFLQKIEDLKHRGYQLTRTNTDKRIGFDGKNTVECHASVSAILEQGTATYTIVCAI